MWSHGEVKKPETINYRTLRPEKDGLFCEKIFGPTRDWECYCGKYKRVRFKGIICERCGVEVTRAKVRRERMGHIELAEPEAEGAKADVRRKVREGAEREMKKLRDRAQREIDRLDEVWTRFKNLKVQDLEGDELLYRELRDRFGTYFDGSMGAAALQKRLESFDLEEEAEKLREIIRTGKGQKKTRALKRLKVVSAFLQTSNSPKGMVLDCVPV